MADYDFNGKVAVVTGGGSGINLAFTKLLYENGCNVVIADLRPHPTANAFLDSIPGDARAKVLFRPTDVTIWSELEQVMQFAETHLGAVPDIVCPGAGVFEPPWSGFWEDTESDDHYKTIQINMTHPIKLTRLAMRAMLRAGKKDGVVVHCSSVAGQASFLRMPIYYATKHALNGFIWSMGSLEQLTGIRVVGVAPGLVKTPGFTDHPEKNQYVDGERDGWIAPEEVASVMVNLCSDKSYPGGTILEVNGSGIARSVNCLNDAGPPLGPGITPSFAHLGIDEVKDFINKDRSH